MALDNLFAMKCVSSFRGELILGVRHSLADCDFYDCFRCYPENALAFYSKNGIGVDNFWDSFHYIYKDDPQDIKQELESIVLNGCIINRDVHLQSVPSAYLRQFSGGIFFLEKENFLFYLISIINRCCLGEKESLGMTLDNILFLLVNVAKKGNCGYREIIDDYFFPCIAGFLKEICLLYPYEFSDVDYALDIYWSRFL